MDDSNDSQTGGRPDTRRARRSLEGSRARLLEAARAKGISLQDLSIALGKKGLSYMHQYVSYNSPASLRVEDQQKVADLLGISFEELTPDYRAARPLTRRNLPPAPPPGIPLYAEDVEMIPANALSHIPAVPALEKVPGAFAIRMAASRGRLAAGDVAYIHPTLPPKQGNTVVVLDSDRLVGAGEMLHLTPSIVLWAETEGQPPRDRPIAGVSVLKVVAIALE